MSFQKKSYATQALGSAGDIVKGFHNDCSTAWGYTSDASVCVGCFVQSKGAASNENEVVGASGKAITGEILGVVTKTNFITSCGDKPAHIYPQNSNVEYLTVGTILVEADSQVAKKGQYVFLKNDTGKIVFDNNSTKDQHTYTGFRVLIGNATANAGVIAITTDRAYIIKNA